MQRRRFGREFKVEAVRLIRERGESVAQAGAIWMFTRMSFANG
jgi:transposase-like protein